MVTNFLLFLPVTFSQNLHTPSGHKQSLSAVRTSNVSRYERYGPNKNFAIFLPLTLNLPKMNLGQNYDTPSGYEQVLCEVGTFNVLPSRRCGQYTIAEIDGRTDRRTR